MMAAQEGSFELPILQTGFKRPDPSMLHCYLKGDDLRDSLHSGGINGNFSKADLRTNGLKLYRRRMFEDAEGRLELHHMTIQRLRALATSKNIIIHEAGSGCNEERSALISALEGVAAAPQVTTIYDFLELPAELRDQIYGLVFIDEKHSLNIPRIPALLHLNKQVRHEAAGVFVKKNTFCPQLQAN